MSKILGSKGINHWYDEQKWIKHDYHFENGFPKFMGTKILWFNGFDDLMILKSIISKI